MGANSKIEWTDHTFNPWRGCEHAVLSDGREHPACAHCYAEAMSRRNPAVLGQWGGDGTRVVASEAQWALPLAWDKKAKAAGERHRVFCASLADVFEDWDGPMHGPNRGVMYECVGCRRWEERPQSLSSPCCRAAYIPLVMADVRRRLFNLIDATPNLDWLILSKRPENVRRMWEPSRHAYVANDSQLHDRRENCWLGTSISDQATADELLPQLLALRDLTPVLFVSVEPLLGPVDVTPWIRRSIGVLECPKCLFATNSATLAECPNDGTLLGAQATLNWIIAGGESGPHARPCHPDWARGLRDQCQAAGVPFLWKQWGEWGPWEGAGLGVLSQEARRINDRGQDITTIPELWSGDEDVTDAYVYRVGKARAGRLLDGRVWDEVPGAAGKLTIEGSSDHG